MTRDSVLCKNCYLLGTDHWKSDGGEKAKQNFMPGWVTEETNVQGNSKEKKLLQIELNCHLN